MKIKPPHSVPSHPLFLISDREVLARSVAVLLANLVRNHVVLGLLASALVVLRALLEDVLLDPVDTCVGGYG